MNRYRSIEPSKKPVTRPRSNGLPPATVKAFTVLRSASPRRCFAMLSCSICKFRTEV